LGRNGFTSGTGSSAAVYSSGITSGFGAETLDFDHPLLAGSTMNVSGP